MQTRTHPQGTGPRPSGPAISAPVWSPEFIAQVRSRVPYRNCTICGESIGAARLTLYPDAATCAWCADQPVKSARPPAAASA